MTMTRLKFPAALLFAGALMVGCDSLEQPPVATSSKEAVFSSENGIALYANSFYNWMPDANNITGNFTIGQDGSGSVDVAGVGGTMRIETKGSGAVNVSRVGGDFIVDSKGSGSIDYDTVKGVVNIPERKRRSRG